MDDTVKDRLLRFIKYKGLSKNRFEETCGFSKRYVSNISQSIQPDKVKKISLNFPELNVGWLLTGEGEMLRETHDVSPDHTFQLRTDRIMSEQEIPLYELTATAGLVGIFNDVQPVPVDTLRVPNLPPVDGAVYVRGDSMSPLLKSGDIIIFKKTELTPDGILWGQIYLLSYSIGGDAYTVVKYVKRSPVEGHIRLISANEFYDPVDIPAKSVTALALVKASITFYTME
jgi:phage repressor protein C with HTH and peptisase S24 domain